MYHVQEKSSITLPRVSTGILKQLKLHLSILFLLSFVYMFYGLETATYVVWFACWLFLFGLLIKVYVKSSLADSRNLSSTFSCLFVSVINAAIATLWVEFVREVRWCWEEVQPLPRMPISSSIDLSSCLINQKLQMVIIYTF